MNSLIAGHGAGFVGVVAQAQHGQGVAQAGEAEADAALGLGFGVLLLERPVGGFEHVVEHADRGLDGLAEAGEVEAALSVKASLTYSVRLIEPRQQQP
jgi:hypothetical protein